MAIKFEQVLVTPVIAKKWLDKSGGNRSLKPVHLERLELEMRAGTWKETPEPIAFDENGDLVDGHHRLTALINSECSISFWVARGVPRGSVNKIDGGVSRSVADRLYAYTDDACVKRLIQQTPSKAKTLSGIACFLLDVIAHRKTPSIEEAIRILRYYEEHVSFALENFATIHTPIRRSFFLAAYVLAAKFASEHSQKMHANLHDFCDKVKSGELLERNEPAYVLREYLNQAALRNSKRISVARTDGSWVMFVKTLRTMQAHLHGEKITLARVPSDSAELIEYFTGPRQVLAKKLKLVESVRDEEKEA